MSLSISSLGQTALILGDVFHNPAQVTGTDWLFSFDSDGDLLHEDQHPADGAGCSP